MTTHIGMCNLSSNFAVYGCCVTLRMDIYSSCYLLIQEKVHREQLEQKVDNLQSENEQLKSERKVAGDQLQKFYKKFFDSVNSIPSQLMYNGISTSTLNRSTLSMRRSGISLNSMTSQ